MSISRKINRTTFLSDWKSKYGRKICPRCHSHNIELRDTIECQHEEVHTKRIWCNKCSWYSCPIEVEEPKVTVICDGGAPLPRRANGKSGRAMAKLIATAESITYMEEK